MTLPPTAAIRENDLQVGQRVVYPNQGVCRISGIETKQIGGISAEFLTMKREEDGATVMVPRAKLAAIGLRHVAKPDEIRAILEFFEAESGDPELDWKVRHRNHSEKMTDGSLTGTAEVLKALHSLAERRPLPQKERELYDSARHLVVSEFAVAMSVSRSTGEDIIDFCLTPPAGSTRAQAKARLKADREAAAEAAEEAELLAGLGDLSDLADISADPTDPPEALSAALGEASVDGAPEEDSESTQDDTEGGEAPAAGPKGKSAKASGAKPAKAAKAVAPTSPVKSPAKPPVKPKASKAAAKAPAAKPSAKAAKAAKAKPVKPSDAKAKSANDAKTKAPSEAKPKSKPSKAKGTR